MNSDRYEPGKTIKWFLIRRENGLEQKLKDLFLKLENYNNSIDEQASLGEHGTELMFDDTNNKRKLIIEDFRKMIHDLYEVFSKIF